MWIEEIIKIRTEKSKELSLILFPEVVHSNTDSSISASMRGDDVTKQMLWHSGQGTSIELGAGQQGSRVYGRSFWPLNPWSPVPIIPPSWSGPSSEPWREILETLFAFFMYLFLMYLKDKQRHKDIPTTFFVSSAAHNIFILRAKPRLNNVELNHGHPYEWQGYNHLTDSSCTAS